MDTIQVVPENDIFEHTETENCGCNPVVEDVNGSRLIIHNAWDNREIHENDFTSQGDAQT